MTESKTEKLTTKAEESPSDLVFGSECLAAPEAWSTEGKKSTLDFINI